MTEKQPPGGPDDPERPLRKPRFVLRHAGDLTSNITAPIWVIKKYIEAKSLCLLFGEPGSGKSFVALSFAYCVSTGLTWNGQKVDQGLVVYIAGEGYLGVIRRLKALEIYHGTPLTDAPLVVSDSSASLIEIDSIQSVIEAVEKAVSKYGIPPKLIVIDTLARNFGPGNENSTEDMTQVIQYVDWYLKDKFNSSVLIVHHAGHGDKTRGRGSSVLKASLDSEYMISKSDDVVNLITTKMKDADEPAPMSFEFESIDLGISDEDGDPVTSAILRQKEYIAPPPKRNTGLGPKQKKALGILSLLCMQNKLEIDGDSHRVTLDDWRSRLEKEGVTNSRQGLFKIKDSLLKRKVIKIDGNYVEVNDDS
ncbi:MAG: helicase RepA family protein [Sedimenticola sp.]